MSRFHSNLAGNLQFILTDLKVDEFKSKFDEAFANAYPERQGDYDSIVQCMVHMFTMSKNSAGKKDKLESIFDFVVSKSAELSLKPDCSLLVNNMGHALLNYENHFKDQNFVEAFKRISAGFQHFDINTLSERYGVSLLMYAIASQRTQSTIVKGLIDAGADIHQLTRRHGRPIHFLSKVDLAVTEKIKVLIEAGANAGEDITYRNFTEFVKWGESDASMYVYASLTDYIARGSFIGSYNQAADDIRMQDLAMIIHSDSSNKQAIDVVENEHQQLMAARARTGL